MFTILIAQARLFPLLPDKPAADYELTDAAAIIGQGILILTTLASVVAVIYILIGAIRYATAFGNPQAMEDAKKTILWSIIGLVISLSCLIIVRYVWMQLTGQDIPTA